MSSRTRYFLIGSVLVVVVGLCTGLVAYYNGNLSTSAAARLPELEYLPADATAVAFADVKDIMASDFRQKLRAMFPTGQDKDRMLAETGIDVEHDIDYVLAAASASGATRHDGMVLFRGRFDETRIAALAAAHGARAEEYHGHRMLLASESHAGLEPAIAFLENGLVALGSADDLRASIDHPSGGLTAQPELMGQIADAQRAGNAWVVGRFDALADHPGLPAQIRSQLPSLDSFVLTANVDRGVTGVFRAQARDAQAAEQARSVIGGALSAARLFAARDPRLATALDGLQVGGAGTSIDVNFSLAPETLEALRAGPVATAPAPSN